MKHRYTYSWLWLMAWRDARKNWSRLLLFVSAIVLGIAVLTAIQGFRHNIERDIDAEAKELLGADLVLRSYFEADSTLQTLLDTLGTQRAYTKAFATMLQVAATGQTRLVQLRAQEGDYPFYGSLSTLPENAVDTYTTGPYALIDQGLMNQFALQTGDTIMLGRQAFTIAGALQAVPGYAEIATAISPKVYISMDWLDSTGLVQKGSRVFYRYYFLLDAGTDADALAEELKPLLDASSYEATTIDSNRENTGQAFNDLTGFLNLVGFIALLLGAVGVAGTVQVYLQEKRATVAMLRTLGVRARDAMLIYWHQVVLMSIAGSVAGALLGTGLQMGMPALLADFLPLTITASFSAQAFLQGVATGIGMAMLFALLPLIRLRRISPLEAIRVQTEPAGRDALSYLIMGIITLSILLFARWQAGSWQAAYLFTGIMAGGALLLSGMAWLLMYASRRFFPQGWPYTWRQGMANLFRPHNQTLLLVVIIGLGTALISTLFFIRTLLLQNIAVSGSDNQPNVILFDIQPSQVAAVQEFTREEGFPVLQTVPIVTLRLEAINGTPRSTFLADSNSTIPEFVFNREYRVTYRDTLIDTETITEGEMGRLGTDGELTGITIEERYAETMEVEVGDTLLWDIAGIRIPTVVSGIREVNWRRVQTNFLVVFPAGLLEKAPQFYVLVSRFEEPASSLAYQQSLVKQFPNVSVIDLNQILATAEEVLGKVSFAIQFMALFSIGTGLLILISSLYLSRLQRIKETVLLRTLGAGRKQLLRIQLVEYLLLGVMATATGMVIALIASFTIALVVFESAFVPTVPTLLGIPAIITGLTLLMGWLNTRSIVSSSPLEVLREEV